MGNSKDQQERYKKQAGRKQVIHKAKRQQNIAGNENKNKKQVHTDQQDIEITVLRGTWTSGHNKNNIK